MNFKICKSVFQYTTPNDFSIPPTKVNFSIPLPHDNVTSLP